MRIGILLMLLYSGHMGPTLYIVIYGPCVGGKQVEIVMATLAHVFGQGREITLAFLVVQFSIN